MLRSGNRILSLGRLRGVTGTGGGSGLESPCDGCGSTNVLTYGADPTGVADSTAAFNAAYTAAPLNGRILVPYTVSGGTYSITPGGVTSWHSRRWIGDLLDDSLRTRIVARSAGTALIASSTLVVLENLDIDADTLADRCVSLTPGHGTYIKNCILRNALDYGLYADESAIALDLVTVRNCDTGLYLLGPNGSTFFNVSVFESGSAGVLHFGIGSGLTAQSGSMAWFGGTVQDNGGAEQILFDGPEGSLYSGILVGGSADGIRFTNNAHNVLVTGCEFVGPETDFAVRVDDGFMCSVLGCTASGSDFARVRLEPGNGAEIYVAGSARKSNIGELKLYVPGATPFAAEPRANGAMVASAAPTVGVWRRGSIVWNSAAGPPNGWHCTVAGTPGTWAAF